MPLRTRKMDGGGGAALLGALGLAGFARLDLPAAPTDGLELAAAVDLVSGRITVSLGGARVSASPADLAAALALPLGPVALAPEVDAAVFSSAEAIAALRRFVNDRVLLGAGEDGGAALEEVAAALRLVEQGKAHAVDWGLLVWAVVEREVVTGEPRRYAPHLLRLMECQRREIFAEVDVSLPLGKRRKGSMLQQCQRTDERLVDCSEDGVGEESLHRESSSNDQCRAAEAAVEVGLVSGVSQNIGESLIPGDSRNDQCRATEVVVEEGLVSGISRNIGDLEEMPVFGKGNDVTGVVFVDYKRAIVEEGEGIHGMTKGSCELGPQKCFPSDVKVLGFEMEGIGGKGPAGGSAKYQSSTDDSSSLGLLRTMDEQDDSSSLQKAIFRTKSQPESNQQPVIELEDEEADDNSNAGAGPSPPVIGNSRFNFIADQSPPHFHACVQQILASVPNMRDAVLDKEQAFMDTQAAVLGMRRMLMEKDYIIASTKNDILEELQGRHATICRLEQDMKAMLCTVQQYEKLFQKSSAAFLEYRSRMLRGEGGESSSEVLGTADEQNHICWRQQLRIRQMINGLKNNWLAKYTESIEQITGLATRMTDLNNEVKRLKVPDLNNDSPRL